MPKTLKQKPRAGPGHLIFTIRVFRAATPFGLDGFPGVTIGFDHHLVNLNPVRLGQDPVDCLRHFFGPDHFVFDLFRLRVINCFPPGSCHRARADKMEADIVAV